MNAAATITDRERIRDMAARRVPLTQKQVAILLGWTRSNVAKTENRAMRKFRAEWAALAAEEGGERCG